MQLKQSVVETIKYNYKKYGLMVNEERMFPSVKDGLKLVNRRILYTLYLLTKNGKLTKSARVVGTTMAKFHPHGDASIYESVCKLYHAGYLDRQGNLGIIGGLDGFSANPPSDMRYTECKLNHEAKTLLFSLIDQVPFEKIELEDEPLFLPTMLPLSFFSAELNSSIGFGVKAIYPTYTKKDLLRRLFWLLKETKTEPIIKPTFNNGIIEVLSSNKECKELLKTGKGSITFRPKIKYEKDKIIIYARPVNKSLRNILIKKVFKTELEQNQVAIIDNSKGDKDTEIVVNIFGRGMTGKMFKNKLDKELTVTIKFNCLYVDEDKKLKRYSVDDMLLKIFNQFKNLWFKKVDESINKLEQKIQDLLLIKKIRPHLKEKLGSKKHYDTIIKELTQKVDANEHQIKTVFEKYSIKILITCSTDIKPLLQEIKDLEEKKTEQYVISMYKNL